MVINNIIETAKREKRTQLTEIEAKELIKEAGIPVVETKLASSKKEAIALSREMGFPVALKIVSSQVIHKTDVGGVKLNLANATQVGRAYTEILKSVKKAYHKAKISGVSVQAMARPGVEVIIGMNKDQQFGPVIMFGLGGIFVEILKDVSFRVVPVTKRDALEMIKEIKGYPVLEGYRGSKPVNVEYLASLIVKTSEFVDSHAEIAELDFNPLFAYEDGAVAVDARIILG